MPSLKMSSLSVDENIKQEFEAEFLDENRVAFRDEENEYILEIYDEKIVYHLMGELKNTLIFEKGQTHPCAYNTPYGVIDMDVKTSLLFVKRAEDIKIVIHYILIIDGEENFNSKEIYIK